MDKIIINGEKFDVVNGYPMIAPFMFYELDEIDEMVEENFEDVKKRLKPGDVVLFLRNLNNPNVGKNIIYSTWDGKGRIPHSDDIYGMENIFKIIVG